MAMLLIEGFDQYSTDAELQRGGWTSTAMASITSTTGASEVHGTLGYSVYGSASTTDLFHAVPTSSATYVLGVAYRCRLGSVASREIMATYQGGSLQNKVNTVSGGEISVTRGTTVLGTSTGAGLVGTVYSYIEVKIFLHASAGTVDVWVEGQNVLSLTSQNTLNTSTAEINLLGMSGANTTHNQFDDLYILDDSGSDNTSELGPVFVETLVPDADGNVNDFTPSTGFNWENVDDIAPDDQDGTYNHSGTATDQELYGFAALAGNIGVVYAVEASALIRKEDAGFREIRHVARSNVTEVEGPNKVFGTNYKNITHIFEKDPDGDVVWDEASVNAAQFGIVLET
jgi:catechol 2,3-dioxygenase-like lactoylglutathione lyase family enzyme